MSQESAPGQGDASITTDIHGNSSTECPTCGRDDFKNRHGMRIHHSQAHGESIAWIETTCDVCGGDTEIEQYKYEQQENVYCSPECQHEGLTEKVQVSCSRCGDTERVIPSRVPTYNYCSPKCKALEESEKWVGENGPNYREGVEITCKQCGTTKRFPPSRSYRQFCGKTCKDKWQSENIRGEDHPNWRGGYDEYYGPNWPEQRRKTQVRDQGRCQVCGATPLDTGREATVHHKKPMRWFQENLDAPEWYEKGNRLDNLVCLCRSCHGRYGDWRVLPIS